MRKLLFIAMIALVAVSCKKEDRIEKNLWKNGGVWNIDEAEYSELYNGSSYIDTELNIGSIIFNENGSGIWTVINGSSSDSEPFNYIVAEDKMTMILDGDAYIWDMDWKKDKLTLTYRESDQYGYLQQKYILTKKK